MVQDLDREQFVAMKIAEAWETYQELLPELPDNPTQTVPWKFYAKAAERMARALWKRRQQREKKRPDRVSIENLRDEPADPRNELERVDNNDLIRHLLAVITSHEERIVRLAVENSYRDAARIAKVSENAVKETLARARAKIRGNLPEDPPKIGSRAT